MSRRRISVPLCAYNGEVYLAEQLESILAQSRPVDEIVACDDSSTDGTWTILKRYNERYPNLVKIYRNDANLGIAKNFSKAIGLCNGEFIAPSAQDDVWHRDKLEKLVQRLEADPGLGLVFSNADRIDAESNELDIDLWQAIGFDERTKAAVGGGHGLQVLLRRNFVTGPTIVFRSTLNSAFFPIVEPFAKDFAEDYWISLIAATVSRIGFVDEKLVKYRQHNSNVAGAPVIRKLSVRQHLKGAFRRGASEYDRGLANLRKLLERLAAVDQETTLNRDRLCLIQQKADFLAFRVSLWSHEISRMQKASLLVHNWMQGSYSQWGNGWRTVAKDLTVTLGVFRLPAVCWQRQ